MIVLRLIIARTDGSTAVRRCIRRVALALCLAVPIFMLGSCAESIGVKQIGLRAQYRELSRSALMDKSLSERTRSYFAQRGLVDAYNDDPLALLQRLDATNNVALDRETLYALMESCFAQAVLEDEHSELAARLYLSSMIHAYRYLFDPEYGAAPSPYHPYSRLACDLYNRSFAAYLSYALARGVKYQPGLRLPMLNGQLQLDERIADTVWPPQEFDFFQPAYEKRVTGLKQHYRTFGIGVPLIAVRKVRPDRTGLTSDGGMLPGIEQTCAVTAFVRFKKAFVDPETSNRIVLADLEFHDPTRIVTLQIDGHTVPLETDFTTPLAFMIARAKEPSGLLAMLNVDTYGQALGLHMLQRYEPGRIPVVFVHGLMSSPMTWMPMLNALMGDPELNRYYQFWFFSYPTGNPLLYSASLLRNALRESRDVCDPEHADPAMDHMVLVAHSMGGLLAKFVVQQSSDSYARMISARPFQQWELGPAARPMISNILFFAPIPEVERVAFISTPHRGSDMALSWYARLGASIARVGKLLRAISPGVVAEATRAGNTGIGGAGLRRMPTGLDGLRPDNPALDFSVATPLAPRITFHSIIGNNRGTTPEGSDGVVAYSSAHLDGAASELVVRSGHGAHTNPLTILEIKRVLLEHLAAIAAATTPAPVTSTSDSHEHSY
jgi:triacylglycerol esterase/lipase EstA (alpha/beta hydrolase family)